MSLKKRKAEQDREKKRKLTTAETRRVIEYVIYTCYTTDQIIKNDSLGIWLKHNGKELRFCWMVGADAKKIFRNRIFKKLGFSLDPMQTQTYYAQPADKCDVMDSVLKLYTELQLNHKVKRLRTLGRLGIEVFRHKDKFMFHAQRYNRVLRKLDRAEALLAECTKQYEADFGET